MPKIKKIIAIFTLLNVKIPLKDRYDVKKVAINIRLMIIESSLTGRVYISIQFRSSFHSKI